MSGGTVTHKLAHPLRNQKGGLLGIIIFLLALVGAWYIYQSYTRGHVKSDLKTITNDYERGIKHGIDKIGPERKEPRQ